MPLYGQTASIAVTDMQGGTLIGGAGININAGLLIGQGGLVGDLFNNGTVAAGTSPGILVVSGNYTQTSGGTLLTELGELTPGSQYDMLQISGTASLDGLLDVQLFGRLFPTDGDLFDILKYTTATGDFALVIEPTGVTLVSGDQGTFYQLNVQMAAPPPRPPPMIEEEEEVEDISVSEIVALEELFEGTTEEAGEDDEEDDSGSVVLVCS